MNFHLTRMDRNQMFRQIIIISLAMQVHVLHGYVSMQSCKIECSDEGYMGNVTPQQGSVPPIRVGKQGPKGEKGDQGDSCECNINEIKKQIRDDLLGPKGTWTNPIRHCNDLMVEDSHRYENGIYVIKDYRGFLYQTYCDLITGGGGWTLVASIHENFMQGHCTIGDRWSSEHGNNASHPHGDGNWENFRTFGRAESATSDDFKSPAYFGLRSCDVMVWHVPNDTPMENYQTSAFMQYHTNTCILRQYGGNMRTLFASYYLIKDKTFTISDNGPAFPVVWDKGDNAYMIANTVKNSRVEVDPGYIQFRVVNHERGVNAFCPGIRMKPNKANTEHVCYGGSSYFSGHLNIPKYCGDFGARDWSGYGTGITWSADKKNSESVIMIFYK